MASSSASSLKELRVANARLRDTEGGTMDTAESVIGKYAPKAESKKNLREIGETKRRGKAAQTFLEKRYAVKAPPEEKLAICKAKSANKFMMEQAFLQSVINGNVAITPMPVDEADTMVTSSSLLRLAYRPPREGEVHKLLHIVVPALDDETVGRRYLCKSGFDKVSFLRDCMRWLLPVHEAMLPAEEYTAFAETVSGICFAEQSAMNKRHKELLQEFLGDDGVEITHESEDIAPSQSSEGSSAPRNALPEETLVTYETLTDGEDVDVTEAADNEKRSKRYNPDGAHGHLVLYGDGFRHTHMWESVIRKTLGVPVKIFVVNPNGMKTDAAKRKGIWICLDFLKFF
jgi:hypothetical protein